MTPRDVAKSEGVAETIRVGTENPRVTVELVELGSLAGIRAFSGGRGRLRLRQH